MKNLTAQLSGELYSDDLMRVLYATDASVYRALPLAVAYPKDAADIQKIIAFTAAHGLSLIPRAAGTSLAGQCVGEGIVVDVSRHMTAILEVNEKEQWVRLQPGVIRDELNRHLAPHGLHFGPNTSTANRCMMGGMVGNNSCGSSSIVYGSTRDHLLEVRAILSDGSEVVFRALTPEEFREKSEQDDLEGQLYRQIHEALSPAEQQAEIRREYPLPGIHRRNTGYAVDLLLNAQPFAEGGNPFNFCTLLAGSEGTLAFITEIKLGLVPLPPKDHLLVCPHFNDIQSAMQAVVAVMARRPDACELMDKVVLDCTKENIAQRKNRFFIEGDPAAVLMIEFRGNDAAEKADRLIADLRAAGLGYAFPKVFPPQTNSVWELRKAGLGLLANIPGDAKAVACIEDTAVAIDDLPAYIGEFTAMMRRYGQRAVYYAHAGAGEIHLRPILNLKDPKDVALFRELTREVAKLVKKYRGSLSGEHGDGRVRAGFIPLMIGKKNYELLRQIKRTWDSKNIFNPGKIVDAPPMNTTLRYEPGSETPVYDTVFNFENTGGILRAAEKCNGSGDCRRLPAAGGTMCPSYHATRREKDTTRARANALREFLTHPADATRAFSRKELHEVMDLCLSCKGCTSECPSNVDMASLKAEFLHQYYRTNGTPWRAKVFGHIDRIYGWAMPVARLNNFLLSNALTAGLIKRALGIAPQRSLPALHRQTLRDWFYERKSRAAGAKGRVFFFCDEFTDYLDVPAGQKAILLLERLGYEVQVPEHVASGRALISKGMLPEAQKLAQKNVELLSPVITDESPLVGLEPSAILTFRDEYPRLVLPEQVAAAKKLGEYCLTIEEFLAKEMEGGRISPAHFTKEEKHVLVHGHCHQKALSSVDFTLQILSLPANYHLENIPSGCCGMAGSFGYEKEHFDVSAAVGEQVLFPAVRSAPASALIAAPGTSCRHQILDGTGRRAQHPAEVLFDALVPVSDSFPGD
jgi:FAD/FMN-containing dehydrogenase/Fe-S oxidoreductase